MSSAGDANHVAAGGEPQGSLAPARGDPHLQADWQMLEALADASPFTSWAWVGTWLDNLPHDLDVAVFRATRGAHLIALALLVRGPDQIRQRLLGRPWHMQETGNPVIDEITAEYGGLLIRRGHDVDAYRALLGCLPGRVDHLHVSACAHAGPINAARLHSTLALRVPRQRPCHFVDLKMIRASDQDYIDHLGRNTRATLRRTRRVYEEQLGALHCDLATSATQAMEWLGHLRTAHQTYWQARGKPGSFASAFFAAFHEQLIAEHHDTGLVHLLRIRAGDAVVGYLYILVWQRQAYFYNGGLSYGLLERHDRPGYLAHMLTVERYLDDDVDRYDFLAGEDDYKRALSTHVRDLHWLDLRTRRWQLTLEGLLRKVSRHATLPAMSMHAQSVPMRIRG